MKLVITADAALRQVELRFEDLGQGAARVALVRAVNHTGRKALTAVRRALVRQTSIPRRVVVAGVSPVPARAAGAGEIAFTIVGSGRKIPLKLFRARQTRSGVSAHVWGGLKHYPSAFIVRSLGHHVFRRVSRRRLPIERLTGPSIADEMVRDQSLQAFREAASGLPDRVRHEIGWLLR